MKILVLISCLFIFNCIFCQSSDIHSKTDSLLHEIHRLQTRETVSDNAGMFTSQRGRYTRREDNTIFFSSLIAFTLHGIKEYVDQSLDKRIDSICNPVIINYPYYQNKSGIQTYNFWKTDPPVFFPNSFLLSHCGIFRIPDDADCTSMIYLTDTTLSSNAYWLQQKLAAHANLSRLKIKNTFKKYRCFKAYSTWFGKKMPIEFDICVQANVLYFIYKNHLSPGIQDKESLSLIHEQIQSGDYIKYAYYLSPSYKKTAIVLYHLARLLEKNTIPELEDCRDIIKNDIEAELKKNRSFMEQVILSTALMRMGGIPPSIIHIGPRSDKYLEDYVFFRANLFSSYARPCLRFISKINLCEQEFYCKSYCLSLLAEYEAIRVKNNFIKSTQNSHQ